jgi:phage-related protein
MPPVLDVHFYATPNGHEPVRDWLKSLDTESKKAIGEDIKAVQYGWPLGMPLVRKMEQGIWEVRSTISDGIARVLFTTLGPKMILLHGFVKKTEKTPAHELKLARQRRNEVNYE